MAPVRPRREVLLLVGAPAVATLAGCLTGNDSDLQSTLTPAPVPTDENWPQTDGNDDEPIEAEPETLVLAVEDMPGDGWRFEDESDWGGEPGHDRSFVRNEVTVHLSAWLADTVEDAKEHHQKWHDNYDSYDEEEYTYDQKDHDIASEGFYVVYDKVDVWFRDANAGARVMHLRGDDEPEQGDVATTLEIAATMHEKWRA